MNRLAPKTEVLRALFARSGNQCAFPGCTQKIINSKNKFIAQVCHIEAALEGGERFNAASSDEYRRSYENLLILCYPHHIETNDVEEYSVERLLKIKIDHEQLFLKSDFKIDESELRILTHEMSVYWSNLEILNNVGHIFAESGLAMKINGLTNFSELIESANSAAKGIEHLLNSLRMKDEALEADFKNVLVKKNVSPEIFSDIPYYENPFINRNWEWHNIGSPNWLQRLRIDLVHIEVKYYEEYLKTHSEDLSAQVNFAKAKELLNEYAKTAMHAD